MPTSENTFCKGLDCELYKDVKDKLDEITRDLGEIKVNHATIFANIAHIKDAIDVEFKKINKVEIRINALERSKAAIYAVAGVISIVFSTIMAFVMKTRGV